VGVIDTGAGAGFTGAGAVAGGAVDPSWDAIPNRESKADASAYVLTVNTSPKPSALVGLTSLFANLAVL
jgi:hypothetical protein